MLGGFVKKHVTAQELGASTVYVDTSIMSPGVHTFGSETLNTEGNSIVLFVDLHPKKNWMHPYRYLLRNADARFVRFLDSDKPPVLSVKLRTF